MTEPIVFLNGNTVLSWSGLSAYSSYAISLGKKMASLKWRKVQENKVPYSVPSLHEVMIT